MAIDKITTPAVTDDSVTLAKMAPGTDGNIISYDASGNPVAVATGSAGQVLTSAGAGAPPTFATPSAFTGLGYSSVYLTGDASISGFGYLSSNLGIYNQSPAGSGRVSDVTSGHITLDKTMEGPDHAASLDVNEFSHLIKSIRNLEVTLGSDGPRTISQGELINRENLSKSIFAAKDIKSGQVIANNMIEIKSPGQGLSPQHKSSIIGKKTSNAIKKGKALFMSDFIKTIKPKKNYPKSNVLKNKS